MNQSEQVRHFEGDDVEKHEMLEELQDCADLLMEKLQSDDISGAAEMVKYMVQARDRSLFNEVGKLTRGLHKALVNFQIEESGSETDEHGNPLNLSDASHRLDYVIRMTQDAANKTMDSVDEISPITRQFSEEAKAFKEKWVKLRRKEIGPDEFRQLYSEVDEFFTSAVASSDQFSAHLQKIILAQTFQDLTGQVIGRVITMVKDVESHLVELVRKASQVEKFIGVVAGDELKQEIMGRNIAPEGPAVRKKSDVVSGQDEVDDLLSSLGF